jgi:antitoxin VapB
MPLNIRSREVDELATRLAARLGTTKTEAVRRALANEIERAEPPLSLAERIRPIQERIAARGRTGLEADKAFYDWLSGDE